MKNNSRFIKEHVSDRRKQSLHWGILWCNKKKCVPDRINKINELLETLPNIVNFIFQMQCFNNTTNDDHSSSDSESELESDTKNNPCDSLFYIIVAITLKNSSCKPVPQLLKLFPEARIIIPKSIHLWRSFCCKDNKRVLNTEAFYYGIDSDLIISYKDKEEYMKESEQDLKDRRTFNRSAKEKLRKGKIQDTIEESQDKIEELTEKLDISNKERRDFQDRCESMRSQLIARDKKFEAMVKNLQSQLSDKDSRIQSLENELKEKDNQLKERRSNEMEETCDSKSESDVQDVSKTTEIYDEILEVSTEDILLEKETDLDVEILTKTSQLNCHSKTTKLKSSKTDT